MINLPSHLKRFFPKKALLFSFIIPILFLFTLQPASASYNFLLWQSFFTISSTPVSTSSPKPYLTAQITSTPTLQPTSSPTPTLKPTPKPHPIVATPKPTSNPPSSSSQDYIMAKINDYRTSQGLSTVKTDSNTCNFAKTRAGEIKSAFNHDGFTNRLNSKSLPYPSYHYVTENIAMTSNYEDVVNMWINSPGHAANMRADTPFVCVEQNGNYFAYEGWKP